MKTMVRPAFLLLLLSGATLFCAGQKPSDKLVQTLTGAIAGSNIYEMSYTIGFAGTVSKQYERFKQLASTATERELRDLAANDNNPVVRLYAFQALKQKQAHIPDDLRIQFRDDLSEVMTLNGCIAGRKSVSELSKQNLRPVTD